MTSQNHQQRRQTFANLSTKLAYLDNDSLQEQFENAVDTTKGWGTNHVLEIADTKVFVKRVPLTELAHQHPFSTKNWHNLPIFYNYGVGSAGFNSYRELLAHMKTTNWVLSGQCENFPLMYHYRIIPREPNMEPPNEEGFNNYIEYWDGNAQIADYVLARRQAPFELVLFLEYFPHTLGVWFKDHVDSAESIVAQLQSTLQFMHEKRFVHLDLHFDNIVTDGNTFIIADFGLALDDAFDLSDEERHFLKQHAYYDYASLLKSLAFFVVIYFRSLEEETRHAIADKFGLENADNLTSADKSKLIEMIESLSQSALFSIDPNFVNLVLRYHDIILLMQDFIGELLENNQKNSHFDHKRLEHLLLT